MLKYVFAKIVFLKISLNAKNKIVLAFSLLLFVFKPVDLMANKDYRRKWVEPTFGPEFTFTYWDSTKNEMISDWAKMLPHLKNYHTHLHQHLIVNQPEGEKFSARDVNIYSSPDGWDFKVKRDGSEIEVNMSPLTNIELAKHQANIQDAIFTSAAAVGLYPSLFQGGGHINIGRNIFEQDALLFRNFFVDFLNHSELAMGIMNYDVNNALPLSLMHPNRLQKIKDIVANFDNNYSPKHSLQKQQLSDFIDKIRDVFGQDTDRDSFNWKGSFAEKERLVKYYSFSILSIYARLEIRSVRPQASYDVFVRQTRLFRNRLKYLKKLDRPLPIKIQVEPILGRPGVNDLFTPPVDPQEALRAFYNYVREAGESWSNHRDYLWPAWVAPYDKSIEESELYKFENSDWFKGKQRPNLPKDLCREALNANP